MRQSASIASRRPDQGIPGTIETQRAPTRRVATAARRAATGLPLPVAVATVTACVLALAWPSAGRCQSESVSPGTTQLAARQGKADSEAKTPAKKPPAETAKKAKPARPKKPLGGAPKRVGQTEIEPIIDGNPQRAVELCQQVLSEDPNHAESLFCLALAYAQLGEKTKADRVVKQALTAGLPGDRFVVGPRRLTTALVGTPTFDGLVAAARDKLIHGPMLGSVTDHAARIWVRSSREVPLQAVLSTQRDLASPEKSPVVRSKAGHDFTAVLAVDGLEPDTVYYYDVLLEGQSQLGPEHPSFRTMPATGRPAKFSAGFGGGAGYTPEHERMWNTLAEHDLRAFLFLGDNVYIDNPTRPDMQRYTYYRRQSQAEYRHFIRSTPIYAIWDDHDFTTNDQWGGPAVDDPAWKVPVWQLFCQNWNNPAYGGGREHPGCWFRFQIADVDFIMLDGRYYRTDPKKPRPSMLGPVQKAWLFEQLKQANGRLKVIASPVPWVLEAKGSSLDTWRGFREEREEIFDFLDKNRIDGVVLISADRHRSDLWRIERDRAYPLYEFESSRLTNVHSHPVMPGALFGYNKTCSFGQLNFDTTLPDPTLTYEIYSIDNELVHSFTLKLSEISHDAARR